MRKVFFSGIKGGTGTTATIANLACALVDAGESVLCIDLDSKNELHLHFGDSWDNPQGWLPALRNDTAWVKHAFTDDDGVMFIPHGPGISAKTDLEQIISQIELLDIDDNTWILLDCPARFHEQNFKISNDDLRIEMLNCDVNCHSLIYQTTITKKHNDNNLVYKLINKFNASAEIEVDIFHLWRDSLTNLAPFYVHFDEVVKESLAYKNVAYNCAPHSVVIDDFIALASWLKTKSVQELL